MRLFEVGHRLKPLRDEGVLILGSGFTTHNLHLIDMHAARRERRRRWSAEFDALGRAERIAARDVDGLIDFLHRAPAAQIAHPRTEHFAPLFVSLGASIDDLADATIRVEGFWYGLSKRSWQFD